jgi:hypothetical protein
MREALSMQYLISVIHDQAGLATPGEHAAILPSPRPVPARPELAARQPAAAPGPAAPGRSHDQHPASP